jgi:hypothetical protein
MASGRVEAEQAGFNWGLLLAFGDCVAFWVVVASFVLNELS